MMSKVKKDIDYQIARVGSGNTIIRITDAKEISPKIGMMGGVQKNPSNIYMLMIRIKRFQKAHKF